MSRLFEFLWLENTDETYFLEQMSHGMSFGCEESPHDETEDYEENWLMDSLDMSKLQLEKSRYHEQTDSYYVTFPSDDEMDETDDL